MYVLTRRGCSFITLGTPPRPLVHNFVEGSPFPSNNSVPVWHRCSLTREWARSLHGLWALLVRRGTDDVALQPERHSLLPRQHPVVVPGGRFRESYYWDTFWTIRYAAAVFCCSCLVLLLPLCLGDAVDGCPLLFLFLMRLAYGCRVGTYIVTCACGQSFAGFLYVYYTTLSLGALGGGGG